MGEWTDGIPRYAPGTATQCPQQAECRAPGAPYHPYNHNHPYHHHPPEDADAEHRGLAPPHRDVPRPGHHHVHHGHLSPTTTMSMATMMTMTTIDEQSQNTSAAPKWNASSQARASLNQGCKGVG